MSETETLDLRVGSLKRLQENLRNKMLVLCCNRLRAKYLHDTIMDYSAKKSTVELEIEHDTREKGKTELLYNVMQEAFRQEHKNYLAGKTLLDALITRGQQLAISGNDVCRTLRFFEEAKKERVKLNAVIETKKKVREECERLGELYTMYKRFIEEKNRFVKVKANQIYDMAKELDERVRKGWIYSVHVNNVLERIAVVKYEIRYLM